jgi:hypothetical protein
MSTKHINPDDPRTRSTEAAEPGATSLLEGVLSEEELQDVAGGTTGSLFVTDSLGESFMTISLSINNNSDIF